VGSGKRQSRDNLKSRGLPTPDASQEGIVAAGVRKPVPLLGGVRGGFRSDTKSDFSGKPDGFYKAHPTSNNQRRCRRLALAVGISLTSIERPNVAAEPLLDAAADGFAEFEDALVRNGVIDVQTFLASLEDSGIDQHLQVA
jgi:hypothetical protein